MPDPERTPAEVAAALIVRGVCDEVVRISGEMERLAKRNAALFRTPELQEAWADIAETHEQSALLWMRLRDDYQEIG